MCASIAGNSSMLASSGLPILHPCVLLELLNWRNFYYLYCTTTISDSICGDLCTTTDYNTVVEALTFGWNKRICTALINTVIIWVACRPTASYMVQQPYLNCMTFTQNTCGCTCTGFVKILCLKH